MLLFIIPLLTQAKRGCNFFDFRKFEIEKTNINTSQSEFGPAFVDDELWYSAFTDKEIEKLSKGNGKDIFYNLFNLEIDKEGNIAGSKKIQFEETAYLQTKIKECSGSD